MNKELSDRSQEIGSNLAKVHEKIKSAAKVAERSVDSITLIVVTKTFSAADIEILFNSGVRDMGENRIEEASAKTESMPEVASQIKWSYLGQIQSRKIRAIASWADSVHSLDDHSHALKFDNEIRIPSFFVQINLEPQRVDRGGIRAENLQDFLSNLPTRVLTSVRGLMAVAPVGVDPNYPFEKMFLLREKISIDFPHVNQLSMGMSSDFESAILHGATHLRIGSSILGSR